ncbi:hypothetical protein [Streptomyces sp. SCSIO ZS0520]|uniref:zinc finger domain-containing protein n=1 Tax=Streptomyces sp. SCSIO ZS0520 TaxID=2892996 RepID=UPI0021D844F7|nr:hypothetical protein [Streptomyces sp. SCSIO ZS0520]
MTPTEAARLLLHASAFDNRQPSEAAATAWSAALPDIPADADSLAAVARYYGTPPARPGERLWIQPHDVRTLRQQIRDERLTGFRYEPVPGDDQPAVYLAALKQQRAAVADGHRPPAIDRPALPGPTMAEVLGGNWPMPPAPSEDAPVPRAHGPLGVICPACGAPIGRPCKGSLRRQRPPHGARRRAAAGLPSVSDTPADIDARRAASARALATEEQP